MKVGCQNEENGKVKGTERKDIHQLASIHQQVLGREGGSNVTIECRKGVMGWFNDVGNKETGEGLYQGQMQYII